MRSRLLATVLATLTLVTMSANPARATATHQIQIDGSPLFSRNFVVHGLGTPWMDADQVQTVTLVENRRYQIRAGAAAASFSFWADAAGHVQYDGVAESFLDGAGTGLLTLVGVDTTIDARYLSGAGVLLAYVPANNADWLRHRTVRLLPSPSYRWQQSSGVIASVSAALLADGTWSYGSAFAGYMGGNGTSTLTFYGYPLLVDARASGGVGVTVQPVWGLAFSHTSVQSLVLLPAHPFQLQIRGGELTGATFALNDAGQVTFDPALPMTVDSFHGLTRLAVNGPLD